MFLSPEPEPYPDEETLVEGESGQIYRNHKVENSVLGKTDALVIESPVDTTYGQGE